MPTLVQIPRNPAAILLGNVPDNGDPPWAYTLLDRYPDKTLTQKTKDRGHRMQALWFEYTRAATSRNASEFPELHGPSCAVHAAAPAGVTVPGPLPDCDGDDCLTFENPGNFSNMSWPTPTPDPTCNDPECSNNETGATAYCANCLPEAEQRGFACLNPKCAFNTDTSQKLYCPKHLNSLIEAGFLCDLCDFMRHDLRDRCQCPDNADPPEPESNSRYILPIEDWLEEDLETHAG